MKVASLHILLQVEKHIHKFNECKYFIATRLQSLIIYDIQVTRRMRRVLHDNGKCRYLNVMISRITGNSTVCFAATKQDI